MTDEVTTLAYRMGWAGVRRLPAWSAYQMFEGLAGTAYVRNGKRVRRMRANYARVRPELNRWQLESLVRDGLRSYFRYWCEAFRLADLSVERIGAMVDVAGEAPVREDLANGRGVVCFLGHLGNWDLAGAWSTTYLAPVTTVAERLKPEEVFAEFLRFRERLGMTIIPLTGGGAVFEQLAAALRAGALVPLLADRDLTSSGLEVDLAGRRARVAPGPAALAVATGCGLHPVSTRYVPDRSSPSGYRLLITFHDRVPDPGTGSRAERVHAMTQACADALGEVVREHTEDWHMMQRVFELDLDDSARTRSEARTAAPRRGRNSILDLDDSARTRSEPQSTPPEPGG